jgi:hypothetical protein
MLVNRLEEALDIVEAIRGFYLAELSLNSGWCFVLNAESDAEEIA